MHRTETIDYGIVLEGELVLVLDESETIVSAGDVVVQRGTSHAWANRSDRSARIAFVLIDGAFEEGLATPPAGWSRERRLDYYRWSRDVVAGLRGVNPALEQAFDEAYDRGLALIAAGD
jgi:hypothetical protein